MTPPMDDKQQDAPEGLVQAAAGEQPGAGGPPVPPEGEGRIEGRGGVEQPGEEGAAGGGAELARQAQQQIEAHIPPEFRSAVERLVLAGMKVMFDANTHELAMRQVQDAEDPAAGAATGVAALMSQLTNRVKGEMPVPAIVPAALILLMEALAFLAEGGQVELTPDIVSDATQDLAGYLMQKLGLTPEKVAEAQDVIRQGGAQPPQGAGAPPGPPAPPMAGGLIGSQMGA